MNKPKYAVRTHIHSTVKIWMSQVIVSLSRKNVKKSDGSRNTYILISIAFVCMSMNDTFSKKMQLLVLQKLAQKCRKIWKLVVRLVHMKLAKKKVHILAWEIANFREIDFANNDSLVTGLKWRTGCWKGNSQNSKILEFLNLGPCPVPPLKSFECRTICLITNRGNLVKKTWWIYT